MAFTFRMVFILLMFNTREAPFPVTLALFCCPRTRGRPPLLRPCTVKVKLKYRDKKNKLTVNLKPVLILHRLRTPFDINLFVIGLKSKLVSKQRNHSSAETLKLT